MTREKILVCGSRNWKDWDAIDRRISQLPPSALIIEGMAPGADSMAAGAARARGHFLASVECAPEHWDYFGKRAGYLRNCAMLDLEPDLVLAFSTGSRGTQLTIDEARKRCIPVEVYGKELADG